MSDIRDDYGLLMNPDIKLHRLYFKQMTKLLGINAVYEAPRPKSDYDGHGDLLGKYYEPIKVGVIFQEHPDQKTLKKMGWVAELQEGSSMIHVPYDLPHLEQGALFTFPSGLDNGKGRKFRVISMQVIMMYPASITCEVAPEYEDVEEQVSHTDFRRETTTLLIDNEEDD